MTKTKPQDTGEVEGKKNKKILGLMRREGFVTAGRWRRGESHRRGPHHCSENPSLRCLKAPRARGDTAEYRGSSLSVAEGPATKGKLPPLLNVLLCPCLRERCREQMLHRGTCSSYYISADIIWLLRHNAILQENTHYYHSTWIAFHLLHKA